MKFECALFPTPVGVFPTTTPCRIANSTLPHARGGVSYTSQTVNGIRNSSPRTWGCFQSRLSNYFRIALFPTPVGVFLIHRNSMLRIVSLPHARGGVSRTISRRHAGAPSSPRPWGCFRFRRASPGLEKVFPSHVGGFHGQRPCPTNLQVFPTLVKGVVWNQKRLSILIASIEREEQGTSPPIRLSAVQMQFDFDDI